MPAMITIQRGLTTLRWNTSDSDVTVDDATWPAAAGAVLSALAYNSDGTENNADVIIFARSGGPVEYGDAARGLLDGWPISIKLFDPTNPAGAVEIVPGATIGSAQEDSNGVVTIAASGQLIRGAVYVTEHYSLAGREDLGDDRCKIPIVPADIGRGVTFQRADTLPLARVNDAYGRVSQGSPDNYGNVYFECTTAGTTNPTTAPSYNFTPGATTTDGTAVFTARNAWTRSATGQAISVFEIQFDSLPDSRASDATWFVLGAIFIRSGPLSGFPKLPIRAWNPATKTATLFLPVALSDVPAGTAMEVHAGCDLTREMCFSRFNNIVNLRAETFVPPPVL
jgi:hypothetical protein